MTIIMILALIMSGFAVGHGAAAHFRSSALAQASMAPSLIFVLYTYIGGKATAYLNWFQSGSRADLSRSSRM
jgi:hypothetical protein